MNQAMTCSLVPMSGPMMSVCGPTKGIISCMYRRLTASSSRIESSRGLTVTPPFAPPYGKPANAHFQLIQIESAAISPRFTLGAKRVPPLVGPIVRWCCTR